MDRELARAGRRPDDRPVRARDAQVDPVAGGEPIAGGRAAARAPRTRAPGSSGVGCVVRVAMGQVEDALADLLDRPVGRDVAEPDDEVGHRLASALTCRIGDRHAEDVERRRERLAGVGRARRRPRAGGRRRGRSADGRRPSTASRRGRPRSGVRERDRPRPRRRPRATRRASPSPSQQDAPARVGRRPGARRPPRPVEPLREPLGRRRVAVEPGQRPARRRRRSAIALEPAVEPADHLVQPVDVRRRVGVVGQAVDPRPDDRPPPRRVRAARLHPERRVDVLVHPAARCWSTAASIRP